jgi:uracil phosphoribosyltransferase
MKNLHFVEHPLVRHHLTALRDVATGPEEFRSLARRLTRLLAFEATRDLELLTVTVETPLTEAPGARLAQRIGVVPILRAGLGMADSLLELIPGAEIWHLGFYRDESTLRPVEYYKKLPQAGPPDVGIIVDPMLATGGSANAAVQALAEWGVKQVKVLAILAAPEGIRAVHDRTPDTAIFLCAVDERLNEKGYIVPGLGDAGDRMFNTLLPDPSSPVPPGRPAP